MYQKSKKTTYLGFVHHGPVHEDRLSNEVARKLLRTRQLREGAHREDHVGILARESKAVDAGIPQLHLFDGQDVERRESRVWNHCSLDELWLERHSRHAVVLQDVDPGVALHDIRQPNVAVARWHRVLHRRVVSVAVHLSHAIPVALVGCESAVGAVLLDGRLQQFTVDEGQNVDAFPWVSVITKGEE